MVRINAIFPEDMLRCSPFLRLLWHFVSRNDGKRAILSLRAKRSNLMFTKN
jgi:hypothetical protein